MAEQTAISWADGTFNPWEGCQETASPACVRCYAKARNARFNGGVAVNWGPHAPRRRTSPANWRKLALWNREPSRLKPPAGAKPFVFGGSLCDPFDNAVPAEWRRDYFDEIRAAPNLVVLLLTKRPQNIEKMAEEAGGLPPNVALGCTVVTQDEADRDIPFLLKAAAALKPIFVFVSMEPLAEAVNLRRISTMRFRGAEVLDALTGTLRGLFGDYCATKLPRVDWVITGGESGPGAVPSNPQWFRDIREQCRSAGTLFHHKQNGEWASVSEVEGPGRFHTFPDHRTVRRVGKERAGATLDGKIIQERPFIPAEAA